VKTLEYNIHIRAPVSKVWHKMLDPEPYQAWTSAFTEGSSYEGDWSEGSKILFLNGNQEGMVARIVHNTLYEKISIMQVGFVSHGVEDTTSDAVRSWAPLFENYYFKVLGDETELRVTVDVTPEFESMMDDAWPIALEKLKAMCEAS
jgi:uncharacterized protein YndB with AHSA1/START domain